MALEIFVLLEYVHYGLNNSASNKNYLFILKTLKGMSYIPQHAWNIILFKIV